MANNTGTINQTGPFGLDLNNTGTVNVQNGFAEFQGNVTSTTNKGQFNILTGGTLQFDLVVSGNTITFSDATGILNIQQLGSIANTVTIAGLRAGDAIQIPNLPAGFRETYNPANGTLILKDAANVATLGTLVFGGSALPTATVVQNAVVQCFATGVAIATPEGERLVETLRVGDRVRLEDGSSAPIAWVGRRRIDCARHPDPGKVRPYRVAAHAFGRNTPARDVLLSPDHAIHAKGVLIPVKYLDNGTTIRQVAVRAVTYHHFELRDHAIVSAAGLPVETLLPGGAGRAFASDAAVTALHPDFSAPGFSTHAWEAFGCAPLVVAGPVLNAVRARLNQRAAAMAASVRRAVRKAAAGKKEGASLTGR